MNDDLYDCKIRYVFFNVLTINPDQVHFLKTVDRDAASWFACRPKCGKIFSGVMSDDDQLACIKGCCSTSLRSLSHHGKCSLRTREEKNDFQQK